MLVAVATGQKPREYKVRQEKGTKPRIKSSEPLESVGVLSEGLSQIIRIEAMLESVKQEVARQKEFSIVALYSKFDVTRKGTETDLQGF